MSATTCALNDREASSGWKNTVGKSFLTISYPRSNSGAVDLYSTETANCGHSGTCSDQLRSSRSSCAARFLEKTRAEWEEIYEGTDACVSPVLDLSEAPAHPHNVARGLFQDLMGNQVPGPAPRLQRTPAQFQGPPPNGGQHTDEILSSYGYAPEEIKELRSAGTAG